MKRKKYIQHMMVSNQQYIIQRSVENSRSTKGNVEGI